MSPYYPTDDTSRTDESIICPICYDTIDSDSSAFTTICNHQFHHNCIRSWACVNNSCPNCRCPDIVDLDTLPRDYNNDINNNHINNSIIIINTYDEFRRILTSSLERNHDDVNNENYDVNNENYDVNNYENYLNYYQNNEYVLPASSSSA